MGDERRLAVLEGSTIDPALQNALEQAGYTVVRRSAAELAGEPSEGALCPTADDLRRLLRYWQHHNHLVVHDLKSPFAGLNAYLEVLQMDPPKMGSTLAKATDGAAECAGEMRHMLQAIVDLHRLEVGELDVTPEKCELREVAARGTASFVASRQKGRLVEHFGADAVPAVCDARLTENIVSQLVLHALRYASDGGVEVSVAGGDDFAEIQVQAGGDPIPESARAQLFERFARAAPPHEQDSFLFGLGLPFAHAAAHAQDGSLAVHSDEGGTLFRLQLPTRRDDSARTVLVVDDEPLVRDVAVEVLRRQGYEVFSAGSGQDAVRIVRERPIDLLVLDVVMPGFGGVKVYETLQPEFPDLQYIFTTGMDQRSLPTDGDGAFDVLLKPYPLSDLVDRVAKALSARNKK